MSTSRKILKYKPETMTAAIEDCDRGMPVATAAKKHGVPRITLLYKVRGKTPRNCQMGLQSYLSKEENLLVSWIIKTATAGFPVTKTQLLDSVQHLITELKIPNPFKNNRPGNSWYKLFMKRNPEVSIRTAQNLTSTRAAVTKTHLDAWFKEVFESLTENGYADILKHPARVYNCDEAAFFLNPKGDRVLAKRGERNVYQIVNSDEKECLTVLVTGNAAGDVLPPSVVFRYERIPRDLALSVPEFWGIGKSESGWMTGELFYEFLANVFHPWLVEKNITLPVILFVDGHASHLTLHSSRFCEKNGIILVALYPNATHKIQPMDVAVFRTMKAGWKENVHQWRLNHTGKPTLKKTDFCPLFQKTIEERLHPVILQNGFRRSGLVPWNPEAVDMERKSKSKEDLVQKNKMLRELESGKYFLEKYVDRNKIDTFKKNDIWEGDIQDTSLFNFYKQIVKDGLLLRRELLDINDRQDELHEEVAQEDSDLNKEQNIENNEKVRKESPLKETVLNAGEKENKMPSDRENLTSPQSAAIDLPQDQNVPRVTFGEKTPVKSCIESKSCHIHTSPVAFEESSGKSLHSQEDQINIPTPFKKALLWPGERQPKKRRLTKERIPALITSRPWQLYHERKEAKKMEEAEKKRQRAKERQEKKEMKDRQQKLKIKEKLIIQKSKNTKKPRRQKISSDSDTSQEWQPSSSSEDEDILNDESELENISTQPQYTENDYVIVAFPGQKKQHKFVCVIQQMLPDDEAEVVAMKKCDDGRSFKLNENDISVIQLSQIIEKLEFPNMMVSGDRIKYTFQKDLEVDG